MKRLRETNSELEIQLKVYKSKAGETSSGRGNRGVEEENRRIAEMQRIEEMIKQRCKEEEIALRVKTHIQLYSDYGEERRNVINTQFEQLRSIMMPTKITKMLLWLLEQDDSFFTSSEIWETLLKDIKIDNLQKERFLALRNHLGKHNTSFKQSVHKLHLLEQEILRNMSHREDQMVKVTQIFKPLQQAKFLHWVENNEACVQLLDTLWKNRTKVKPENN